ncbi:hypothetical protein [Acinetobacter thermotolerans]|uniref:hypothetical protein n=1 Tax=Acinetobacter thermotolerans TaxID=3151487 RepID=UPI00325BCB3E
MKFKVLSCAIFSCMLAACNDSDHDQPVVKNPNTPTTPSNPSTPSTPSTPGAGGNTLSEFYTYTFNSPQLESNEYDEARNLLVDSAKKQIANGILYYDTNTEVSADYTLDDTVYFGTYVTAKGVFQPDKERVTNLGYKLERVIENTGTSFVSAPATIPENDIRNVTTLEWHDLSGKKLTERTNLAMQKIVADKDLKGYFSPDNKVNANRQYYNQYLQNFIKLQSERSFPSGAKCFRVISEDPKTEYIEFSQEIEPGVNLPTSLAEWAESYSTLAKSIVDGRLANLNYKKAEYLDNQQYYKKYFGAIEYNGKVYESSFSEKLVYADANALFLKNTIAQLKSLGAEGEPLIKQVTYQIEGLNNNCDGYNVEAAKVLNAAIKDAQPK